MRDLIDIWTFGAREWDIATADRYLADINAPHSPFFRTVRGLVAKMN